MKCLRKQTNCAVLADFRDATFVQTGPNSGFLLDFFCTKRGFCARFCQINLLFGRPDGKIRGWNAKFRAPEFFFRGSKFFFRGSDEKIPVQKRFRGGSGGRFSFPLELFPGHVSRVILSAESPGGLSRQPDFCAGSVPCSVKRAGSEGIPRHFDSRMARVDAFFPRRPGPAAGYANLRRRK